MEEGYPVDMFMMQYERGFFFDGGATFTPYTV